jgi:hypothetical protein
MLPQSTPDYRKLRELSFPITVLLFLPALLRPVV